MIHRLIVYDSKNHEGLTVFDRLSVDFDTFLLVTLIRSMVMLSKQLGKVEKGYLKEIEIGRYQISLLDHKELTYIIIQGAYDNELFTRRVLNLVVESYHQKFLALPFKSGLTINETYQIELQKFIRTLNFPDELLPEVDNYVGDLLIRMNNKIDLLFITDLDNGIAKIFSKPINRAQQVITLLMQILSEIPLEKSWIGESKISYKFRSKYNINADYEGWIIQRIGLTEFCIIARGFYLNSDRDNVIIGIEELSDLVHEAYINWSLRAMSAMKE